tara:strand:- start:1296 stop:3215 length:1920 start_codon:yes stop_codon:yes gene_type:complete
MSNKIWDDKFTDLTLNGPKITVSSDTSANINLVAPNGQTGGGVTDQTSVTFSVTGVSTFADGTNADGGISYEWREINDGALGVSTRFTGAGTSSLTFTHFLSPEDNGKQYFNRMSFTPDNVSAGGTSGIALNNFIDSTPVSITIAPELFISAGVTTSTVTVNQNANFSCLGGINRDKISSFDTNQENNITYQWYLDGSALSNGTVQKQSAASVVTKTFGVGDHTLVIPGDAEDVSIRVVAGAGGDGGNDSGSHGGDGGQGRIGKFSLPDGGRTLTIHVGGRGGEGAGFAAGSGGGSAGESTVSRGGFGGNAGPSGASGSGGGGAGGVFIFDSVSNEYLIAAGGGGGAGGGSLNQGDTEKGGNGGDWQQVSVISGITRSGNGSSAGGDGGGGGGGGGGYRGGSGGGAGSDARSRRGRRCFTSESKIMMANNTKITIEKPISEVEVGDYVMNKDMTSKNKVVFLETHAAGIDPDENLYSPNDKLKPFATENHPLYINGQWVAVDHKFAPWMEKYNIQEIKDPILEKCGLQKLHNLWVDGDGTYVVNKIGTHSGLYDGGWMRQVWEQGLMSHEDVIKFIYEYSREKYELMHGAFLLSRLMGRFNNKLLNRFGVYMIKCDDSCIRKKISEFIMKLLQRRFKNV